jgi:hypothetical protein
MDTCLKRTKRFFSGVVLLMVGLGWWPAMGIANENISEDSSSTFAWIKKAVAEHVAFDLRILTYGIIQEPANSSQNPENDFLQMPHYVADLEIRPDLRLTIDPLELSVKPRMRLEFSYWQEGNCKGDSEWNDEWYINEWLTRLKLLPSLFVSYGRENLQWGPSYLFSPSNPFFRDNGRRNPYLEVPGMDFGRVVCIPGSSWTLSFIANTDEGQNEITGPVPFEKTYALKVDYTGRENYASAILSYREGSKISVGFFGGWTVSDAILLYGEGVITQGNEALYPQIDSSPFGASMLLLHRDDDAIKPILLIGGSYTFATNGTLTMEYAYNGPGYSNTEADTYYTLRHNAANALGLGGMISGLAQMTLGQTASTGLRFLRRNYVMIQYTQTNIKNKIDLTARWTQNLDDGSGQFTGLVTYYLGNHMELFSVGTVMEGKKDSEFGSLMDYQCMIGLKYTF